MELDMTKGKPMGLMLRFLIPVAIGNIFQQLYNTVDSIIVGRFVGVGALGSRKHRNDHVSDPWLFIRADIRLYGACITEIWCGRY